MTEFMWKTGDMWRDLDHEFSCVSGAITVVTENGTSRVLHMGERWQMRVPLHGAHAMELDCVRQPLATIDVATSCGLVTTSRYGWHATTPLIAVLVGAHGEWASSTEGAALIARQPSAPRHPARNCGAAYCVERDRNADA